MCEMLNVVESEIVHKVKKLINNRKQLILVDCPDLMIAYHICKSLRNRGLQDVEIWQNRNPDYIMDIVKYVTKNEMVMLIGLYSLYDFTDNITMISETYQYGSLFNYVKTGILTPEEMVEALLYDI